MVRFEVSCQLPQYFIQQQEWAYKLSELIFIGCQKIPLAVHQQKILYL